MRNLVIITTCLSWIIGFNINAQAQCKEAEVWDQSWLSCQTSPNPNPDRGTGHWIQYDFGDLYSLKSLHVWNANKIEDLDKGIQEMTLDYSEDGESWTEWGKIFLDQASGKSYYSGEKAAELDFISARYVILSVNSNWGHPDCSSISEVSFELGSPLEELESQMVVYPNPATLFSAVRYESKYEEEIHVELWNVLGQMVYQDIRAVRTGIQEIGIPFIRQQNGIYVLKVYGENGRLIGTDKVVVSVAAE
ncbi:MAG: T9SS type A sorting domain-containing protein [Bacteroidia bacterium]|nr:T9SS type A sorting domain-containing protein [Bacteroidia bacterium]